MAAETGRFPCGGQCGAIHCQKRYFHQRHLAAHLQQARPLLDDVLCGQADMSSDDEDKSGTSDVNSEQDEDSDEPAQTSEVAPDQLLDQVALLYAVLDSEHLQHAQIVRIFEAIGPYVTVAAQVSLDDERTKARTAEILGPCLEAACHMVRSHGQYHHADGCSRLRQRLTKMGFLEPTQVHPRHAPGDVGGSVYEVDQVEDLLQLLEQQPEAAEDFAASDRRWRELADRPPGLPVTISDIEHGVLFQERVLPVMRHLRPDQLLVVALPYMDDVDVCNAKGASSGVHQQNFQYVTYVNLSPGQRTQGHCIRFVACCPTSLTHHPQAGFSFVISDLGDKHDRGMSLGAQSRRLLGGVPFDLSTRVPALSHIRELYLMNLFVMGDNKGLNEAFSFNASFHPNVWSYCRSCPDVREGAPANRSGGCAIVSKWAARQHSRDAVATGGQVRRFMADKGAGWLRTPELFEELQRDVRVMCESGQQEQVAPLLQMLGANHQLNSDGSVRPHGYSGVPFLESHWDYTKPPDGMHDWPLGWSSQLGGAFLALAILRGWIPDVDVVNDATREVFANLAVSAPRTKLKKSRYTSTWYDPCAGCAQRHRHEPKRRVVHGDCKLPWHAADTLHWMLHSLDIFLLIPGMRAQLCRPYAQMDPAVYAYVLHVEVLGRLCAYRFESSELPLLEEAVALALDKHQSVPEYLLISKKAKLHCCTHTVLFILLCGPLRLWWCMRLEGKHQPLKALAVRCNFKNVSYSIALGAMRQQAYMYSFWRLWGKPQKRGAKLACSVGLVSSPVLTEQGAMEAVRRCPEFSPQAGGYHVTHWEHATCGVGGVYRRGQIVAMICRPQAPVGGRVGVHLCMVTGGLEAVSADTDARGPNRPAFAAVVVHVLRQEIIVAAHSRWTLCGTQAELLRQLRSLSGYSRLLAMPVPTHHPYTDIVPVSVHACPVEPSSRCVLVPEHSGFA